MEGSIRNRRMGRLGTAAGSVLAAVAVLTLVAASAQAASGTWERAWGKNVLASGGAGFLEGCTTAADCQAGSSATSFGGELDYPQGVATDAAGNVYVADTSNNRIQKFDAFGTFLLAWGKDVSIGGGSGALEVCTVATDCKAGETTTAAGGELSAPTGVATDTAGNVFVADTGNNRIQRFDSVGGFQRAWGKDVSIGGGSVFHEVCTVATDCRAGGTSTATGGEFSEPDGLAANDAGVFVADSSNNRIQRFTPDGGFTLTWGEDVVTGAGTGSEICMVAANCKAGTSLGAALGGEFDDPFGVATDPFGNVLIADSSNDRMQRFDSAGNFQLAFGKDVASAGPGNTGTGFEICVAARGDTCKIGSGTTELGGELNFPLGVATDAAGDIYVVDGQNGRIQKFAALNFVSAWGKDVITGAPDGFEVCTAAATCKAAPFPPGSAFGGELNSPYGLATDGTGSVYVADSLNYRIQKFADPPAPPVTVSPTATGRRAAALKKCKKKRKGPKRKKCIKRAKKLPV